MTTSLLKVKEGHHSTLGPSGSPRWMNCAGSSQLIAKLKSKLGNKFDPQSYEAAEGSAAHHVAAKALLAGEEAWEYMGTKVESGKWTFEVDQEMVDGIQMYLDFINGKMEQYSDMGARLYVEHSMSSFLDEDASGTGDVVIFVPEERIIVVDFKYGKGVVVEPDGSQNKEYGYLACENFPDVKVVELFIVQPRIPHPKGFLRRHVTNRSELEEWFIGETIPAMAATRDPQANLTIGEWCRFCPARDHCPALKHSVLEFDTTVEPVYLTGKEIGELLQRIKVIVKYEEKLRPQAFKLAMKGEEVAGHKLVRQMANRVFKDKTPLVDTFGDDAYAPKKLLGPKPIEKLKGGKKFVAKWAFKPVKGLTLASDSDKREAVRLTGDEFFGDEPVDV